MEPCLCVSFKERIERKEQRATNVWKGIMLLSVLVISLLPVFILPTWSMSTFKVQEILSIKTGKDINQIGNEFSEVLYAKYYAGFAVTSKDEILISDRIKERVVRFSKDGKVLGTFRGMVLGSMPPFIPDQICLDSSDNAYVHDLGDEQIQVFSPQNTFLRIFGPNFNLFNNMYRYVPIEDMKCIKDTITLTFRISKGRPEPVYEDKYDLHFNLLERKFYPDAFDWWSLREKAGPDPGFFTAFEDLRGNRYGYPIMEISRNSLPLTKHSPEGTLLYQIDGPWLTKRTKYKVYDAYTIEQLKAGPIKGNDFKVVNWYVTPAGTIYALIANHDWLKVLKIDE